MARALGLICACLLLLAVGLAPRSASATTYDGAMAQCNAAIPGLERYGVVGACRWNAAQNQVELYNSGNPATGVIAVYPVNGASPCASRPPVVGAWDGNGTTMEYGGCKYVLRGDVAAQKVCIGLGTNLGKACSASATWDATGAEADSNPTPPSDTPPPPPPPGPKICGVGVCYDNGKKQYCEASSGVCVDAETPAHQPASGCISAGGTTLCVGAPPPLPGNPPISDPATQIKASDQFEQSNGLPNVPTITAVTVNNYNTSNNAPNNGAGAGDKGPGAPKDPNAPPEDDKGDKTSASGGGNCNTPPICEGAAATCMVVTQTWLLRCKGDGGGDSNDGDTTVPGLEGIGEGPGEGFHRTETLLDKLDTGGLGGGGQCPSLLTLDLDQYGIHLDGSDPMWCSILEKAGYMLMFLAAFISLRILSEK